MKSIHYMVSVSLSNDSQKHSVNISPNVCTCGRGTRYKEQYLLKKNVSIMVEVGYCSMCSRFGWNSGVCVGMCFIAAQFVLNHNYIAFDIMCFFINKLLTSS